MSETYTADGTGPFVGAYTMAQGGDLRNVSSVRVTMEAMADDLAYVKTIAEPDGGVNSIIVATGTPVLDKSNGSSTATFMLARLDDGSGFPGAFVISQSVAETGSPNHYPVAIYEMQLPEGATITELGMRCEGSSAGPHVDVPEHMPRVRLFKQPRLATGVVPTLIASAVDTSPDVATYEAAHTVSSAVSEVVARETSKYFLTIEGEAGTNAQEFLYVYSAWVTVQPLRSDPRAA